MPRQINIRYSRAKKKNYTDIQTTNMHQRNGGDYGIVCVGVRATVKIHCEQQLPAQCCCKEVISFF